MTQLPRPLPSHLPRALALVAALVVGGGCAREIVGEPPPLDRPHFPRGLAVEPDRQLLAVVGSNFDLEFNRGSVLLADLAAVDAAIADAGGELVRLEGETSPYVAIALIPSFGSDPVFVQGGSRLLLPTQEQNRISELPLLADGEPRFDCDAVAPDTEREVPLCGEAQESLQLPGNDPFQLLVVDESDERVRAIVTLLNSPDIFYLTLDAGAQGARRLTIDRGRSFNLESYSDRGQGLGVRGSALRPAGGGVRATAFLTVSRTSTFTSSATGVDLVWFDAQQGQGAPLGVFRLSEETGSLSARDIAVSADGSALFVVLRNPDAIARFDVRTSGGAVDVRLGGVVSSCYQPVEIEAVTVSTPAGEAIERVLVTCFENDTIVAHEPYTLAEVDVLRGLGDGPYGLVVDAAHDPPRAYISFFNDDRVAVIDLLDDQGDAALVPRALIGAPRADVETAQ